MTGCPILTGFTFNAILLGLLSGQVYSYCFTHRRKDPVGLKTLVYTLYLANVASTVIVAIYLQKTLIQHFNDPQNLEISDWTFAAGAPLTGTIAALCQFFFAWRIYSLTNNHIATAAVGFSTICRLHSLQVLGAPLAFWSNHSRYYHNICSCYLPKRHKTGHPNSDQVVDKIVQMTVQTGSVTALCALLDIITFLVSTSGTHLIFNLSLAKLYSVSLMCSLNSRDGWALSMSTNGQQSSTCDSPRSRRVMSSGMVFTNGLSRSDVHSDRPSVLKSNESFAGHSS
ncbi:hypothetical protein BT96DRAFT_183780 [Gymnopus androsaceus JB14]|uniref:DUF6534 domain-containing protein n=1 Tax=Gymnopus androsaceus JB14 TaxID=1447944 RepID=A0A6A4H8L2_9AGAR|nr:hypothetical protein BT96DRAFT_183780 [Gymnopus androsaceus JB14]